MVSDHTSQHERALETEDLEPCGDCGRKMTDEPADGCPSFEHRFVRETIRTRLETLDWYETVQRLNSKSPKGP